MRLNLFVAASVDLGFAALSAFRPWWVPKKHQQTARLVYAGATGVLSAASGAESYTGVSMPLDPKKENAVNAAIGIGSAALTYAGWPLLTRFNRWADDKLGSWGVKNPPLVSAAVSIGATTLAHVALLALDNKFEWAGDGSWDDLAEQKIVLPAHVREAVLALLDDNHALDAQTAQVLREQLAAAEFWAMRDDEAGSDEPGEWHVSTITVQVPADAERVVPSRQTYPVRGHIVAPDGTDLYLSIETADGRIASIDLTEDFDIYPDLAAEADGEAFGMIGSAENAEDWDDDAAEADWEAREALFVLRNWPRAGEFEIVSDADRMPNLS
ncbi:hypothetical protein [Brevibacterium luteolum]|uniref:hypothetical protein n=1 Tax=Brevibacterium luteolum TaxID=199591 RepID=UPI00223AAE7C|nr:hypothetical protein [Brevibacterium luteolum]MCT1655790.1 hypothetical protein [Brevibacterium luteolum]